MTGFSVDSNAATVAGALTRAAVELSELEPVNRQAGALIAGAPAPRRRGLLAASVRADVTATGVTVAGHTAYWTYVHWGAPRRHVRAQPWLLAAVEDSAPIVDLYTEHAAAVVAGIES